MPEGCYNDKAELKCRLCSTKCWPFRHGNQTSLSCLSRAGVGSAWMWRATTSTWHSRTPSARTTLQKRCRSDKILQGQVPPPLQVPLLPTTTTTTWHVACVTTNMYCTVCTVCTTHDTHAKYRSGRQESTCSAGGTCPYNTVERHDPKGLSTISQCTEFPPNRGFELISSRSRVRLSN